MSRPFLYVAYPMRLDLGAANAIQTFSTMRELRKIAPGVRLVIPRWGREPSAFESLDALHLPRPAVNKLSKFLPWAGWSYIERTVYTFMLALLMSVWRLRGRGYRAVYVRDAVCAAWLGVLRPLHGARLIYEVHDLEASHPSKASRWPAFFWQRFLPWIDRAALGKACMLVSLTQTFKQWAVDRGVHPPSRIAVIPDAFDPALYANNDRAEARRSVGLPEVAFVVVYAGLTFAYRRLDLLVEAFAQAAPGLPGALLVLVGGRPAEVSELKAQAARLGLPPDRVLFTGQVSHQTAAAYTIAADVLVIPDTVTEMTASPLKLFEYLAAGRPLVCKDMPALREIADERCAIFFPEGDEAALAEAIRKLAAGPDLRARMGRAARETAAEYTYGKRAEKIVEVVARCQ